MGENANTDRRPSPEALLREVEKSQRGRLKIFLGAAPGVGKTYEMLRPPKPGGGSKSTSSSVSSKAMAAPKRRPWSPAWNPSPAKPSTTAAAP